ncbi:MAG: ornithine cyclodeaminase [Proteobacteria bacterium]|jgi:ornithine cyclodeaminase|nr:ornithine cyclodeaminase [Pseudomonadota bacterium]
MKLITVNDVEQMVKIRGFNNFMLDLVKYLKDDFSHWDEFDKSPRHAIHFEDGVIELMPIANKRNYTFKYVNGHPQNPFSGKQTVVATGQLSSAVNGYPLMFSEMTTLTAFRTAATTIIATDLLSKKNSSILSILGTGAQSEFQVLAHTLVRNIKSVRYYDVDTNAMEKFAYNLRNSGLDLIACKNAEEAVIGGDIIVVCTACKGHYNVVLNKWLSPGMHINGLGGDCPGKTELELDILFNSKIVVEYLPQSLIEGEIQRLTKEQADKLVYGELWELITNKKPGRSNDNEITVFDSVGFAIEDYSVLRLVYELAQKYNLGQEMEFIPPIKDPKNLISVLGGDFIEVDSLCIEKLA